MRNVDTAGGGENLPVVAESSFESPRISEMELRHSIEVLRFSIMDEQDTSGFSMERDSTRALREG
jgi:hypothetical protein